ncbi:MAG TPA: patatin-like phospholipase family protein [Candidatus Fimivivens sp.]|nr:patatin-like phospholipase family protein [Candidatus Fimivivens sp.]
MRKERTRQKKDRKKSIGGVRVGLALSGGSAVGIAHIGAVRALREAGVDIVAVSGTSAGSVVAACVAFDIPEERMIEVSRRLSWSNISDFGYSKLGLNSNRPVGALVEELIGDVRIEDAKIPLAIVAADIDTGEKVVFRKGKLTEAIRASTCIPGFFVPVEIDGRRLVDGGIVENLPLPSLSQSRVDVRIGIDLGYWSTIHTAKNVLDVVTNSYAILVRGQGDQKSGELSRSCIVRPHLEGFTISDFKRMDELIDVGYRAMRERIPSLRRRAASARLNPVRIIRSVVLFLRKRAGL